MANYKLNSFNPSFIYRPAPRRGPTSSDMWNDSMNELSVDLANITLQWNKKLVPLFDTIPDGSVDTTVNAYVFGLDGANLWTEKNAAITSRYYNNTKYRPYTIKETIDNIYTYIDNELTLQTSSSSSSSGLTDEQKTAIGDNIFNSSLLSTSTSLDGKSERNRLNTIQLAKDLYGTGYSLDSDGNANLTNSVQAMVNALLVLHNGSWSDDITLDHSSIALTGAQTDIGASAIISDGESAEGANLQTNLNYLRSLIKSLKGTTAYTTALSALYAGGPDSLEDLLVSTNGGATKSDTNPWGYLWSSIQGLSAIIAATNSFTGQTDTTDATPTYTSANYVSPGVALEVAIGELDQGLDNEVAALSGMSVGNFATLSGMIDSVESDVAALTVLSLTDTPATYTGSPNGLLLVNSTEDGIVFATEVSVSGGNHFYSYNQITAMNDFETVASGYILSSPNGTRYRIIVDNAGTLSTEAA